LEDFLLGDGDIVGGVFVVGVWEFESLAGSARLI
jgi:hypothetical protein